MMREQAALWALPRCCRYRRCLLGACLKGRGNLPRKCPCLQQCVGTFMSTGLFHCKCYLRAPVDSRQADWSANFVLGKLGSQGSQSSSLLVSFWGSLLPSYESPWSVGYTEVLHAHTSLTELCTGSCTANSCSVHNLLLVCKLHCGTQLNPIPVHNCHKQDNKPLISCSAIQSKARQLTILQESI